MRLARLEVPSKSDLNNGPACLPLLLLLLLLLLVFLAGFRHFSLFVCLLRPLPNFLPLLLPIWLGPFRGFLVRLREGKPLLLSGEGEIGGCASFDRRTFAFPEGRFRSQLGLAGEVREGETFGLGTPIAGVVGLSREGLPVGRRKGVVEEGLFLGPGRGIVLLGAVGGGEMAVGLEGNLLLGEVGAGLGGGGVGGGLGGRALHEEGVLGRSGEVGAAFEEVVILGLGDWKTVALDHFLLEAEPDLPAELHAPNKYNPSSPPTRPSAS